jgi:glycosyltransferase involved in cell wall biosynthesis
VWHRRRKTVPLISVLVPYGGNDPVRLKIWTWLRGYYEAHLSDFEIVIGTDRRSKRTWYRRHPKPFSKAAAVNNAFKKSRGDILVILDADAYLDGAVIMHWAERLRAQRRAGVRGWAIPYRFLLRLTRDTTMWLIQTNPSGPFLYPEAPAMENVEGSDGSGWGHIYGAMVQILPREAFELVGGWDVRFRGWGGEDRAFLQKMDTLWAHYSNSPNVVYHLWHPKLIVAAGVDLQGKRAELRAWDGQREIRSNDWLTWQYEWANGNAERMRRVIKSSDKDL